MAEDYDPEHVYTDPVVDPEAVAGAKGLLAHLMSDHRGKQDDDEMSRPSPLVKDLGSPLVDRRRDDKDTDE